MIRISHFILFLSLIFCQATLIGQTRAQRESEGLKNWNVKDYFTALQQYKVLSNEWKEVSDYLIKYAECARYVNAYALADSLYGEISNRQQQGDFPACYYWRGVMNQYMGKYGEAKNYFQEYLKQGNQDAELTAAANKHIADCSWAGTLGAADPDIRLENMSGINTPDNEFGPVQSNEKLYYSALREDPKAKKAPKSILANVFTNKDGGGSDPLQVDFKADKAHIAHTAFNSAKNKMYFTICKNINETDKTCQIYSADINGDSYGAPMMLGADVNLEGFTATQPAIGKEGGKEYLYFVSDRPGGAGKLDIWKVSVNNSGTSGNVMNLTGINTAGNDITPFIDNNAQVIYFSTDGLPTMGGYDVYQSAWVNNTWNKAIHVGPPVSSSYNDIYYSTTDNSQVSYMASNREEATKLDNNIGACCNDIFKINDKSVITLKATTFNKRTLEALNNCEVVLCEQVGNELKLVEKKMNPNGNNYVFELKKNKNYVLKGTKDKFLPDSVKISTVGLSGSQTIEKKLNLSPDDIALVVNVFDKKTKQPLNGSTTRLIEITPEGKELILDSKTNANGNNFTFYIQPGKKYKIESVKEGYISDVAEFNTMNVARGESITKDMYLDKMTMLSFIPLRVYFDNDEPTKHTKSGTTRLTYEQSYNAYMKRKQVFMKRCSEMAKGEDQKYSSNEMERFFEDEVRMGFENLQIFAQRLLEKLNNGESYSLRFEGFASPRAETKYNEQLTKRRMKSLINYMERWNKGAFKKFIKSGQLTFIEQPWGETKAPLGISDKINDQCGSIFSIDASKERRAEIIEIRN